MPKETITDIRIHPAASLFRIMSEDELEVLGTDIEENGQHYPCVFYKGEMIDGRNRWLACKRKGIKPLRRTASKEEVGGSVEKFVASMNSARRDQSKTEKAIIGASLAAMEAKRNRGDGTVNNEIGQAIGVSARYIDWAKVVADKGSPKLKAALKKNTISLVNAGKLAKCASKTTQDRCLREGINSIRSEIGRHAEPGSADAKYLLKHDALPPTSYVDDRGRKVPEDLFAVWDQRPLIDDEVRALRSVATELSSINKVLQLRDIDEFAKELRVKAKTLADLTPTRLDKAFDWITLGETK